MQKRTTDTRIIHNSSFPSDSALPTAFGLGTLIPTANGVACRTFWVQFDAMKRSIDLDDDLAAEVNQAAAIVREKPATVIRLALRAGLPLVTN